LWAGASYGPGNTVYRGGVFLGEVNKGPIQLLEIEVATSTSWGEKFEKKHRNKTLEQE
jgi:hypothetical protein